MAFFQQLQMWISFAISTVVIFRGELHKNQSGVQSLKSQTYCMFTPWQYRLWSFQMQGTKLEGFLPKNQVGFFSEN